MKYPFKLLLSLLLFLLISFALFAGDSIQTEHINFILRDDVKACRYQINSEADDQWVTVDMKAPSAEWISDNTYQDRVYYQYTLDGKNWSNSVELFYDLTSDRWEPLAASSAKDAVGPKVSVGGLYIHPLGTMPQSMYKQGYGGTLRIDNPLDTLNLFGEVSYWKGDSENDLIDAVHTGLAGVGVGYQMHFGVLSFTPEIGAGLLLEVPVHSQCGLMSCFDGYGKVGLGISGPVSERQEIFIRGDALLFSGIDQIAIEAAVTAGMSIVL